MNEQFDPKIIGFVCNWCTYAAADLAGTSRIKYPPNVRLIRVTCSGRIDPLFILKAFQKGADGVFVGGCHPGDCHYTEGNYFARRRFFVFLKYLEYLGIDPRRVKFQWISASEGKEFSDSIADFTEEIKNLGVDSRYKPVAAGFSLRK